MQYTTTNDIIKVNLDGRNLGTKTELRQKVLIQVSVREPHIDMLNKYPTGFYISYDRKILVCFSDSTLQIILLPKIKT